MNPFDSILKPGCEDLRFFAYAPSPRKPRSEMAQSFREAQLQSRVEDLERTLRLIFNGPLTAVVFKGTRGGGKSFATKPVKATSRVEELEAKLAELQGKLKDWEHCYQIQVPEAAKLQGTLLAIRVLIQSDDQKDKDLLIRNIASLPHDLVGDMRWSWPSETVPVHELIGE